MQLAKKRKSPLIFLEWGFTIKELCSNIITNRVTSIVREVK